MYRGYAIAAATIGACTLIVYTVGASAQETLPCPAGNVYITADTRAQATAAGIPATSQCWNPNDVNVGQSVGQSKQDLQGMWCGNSNAQCTYQGSTYTSTIDGLDPKFAVCADKFMQALRQQSPGACINSAYRSTAQQMCACARTCPNGNPNGCSGLCAPPGRSYHQKGLAIDVGRVSIQQPQFWNLALQFGVGNPTGLHGSDPYHIQAMNGGSNCASLGYQPTDADTFTPGPISNNPYFNYSQSPLPSMMPSAFNQMQPQPSTAGQTYPNVTGQACAPQFLCSNNTIYFQSSSCTQQVYQTCPYGCSGTVCLPNPAASTTSPILGTTYPIIVQPATSALSALQQFTNPIATATAVARSGPLALTPGIYDIIRPASSTNQTGTPYASSSPASNEGIPTQQTFNTSLPTQTGYSNTPTASLVSILQNLQSILTNFLNYLLVSRK